MIKHQLCYPKYAGHILFGRMNDVAFANTCNRKLGISHVQDLNVNKVLKKQLQIFTLEMYL